MYTPLYWWELDVCWVVLIDDIYHGDHGGCDPHGDPDDWSYQPVHCGPMELPLPVEHTGRVWNNQPLVP